MRAFAAAGLELLERMHQFIAAVSISGRSGLLQRQRIAGASRQALADLRGIHPGIVLDQ